MKVLEFTTEELIVYFSCVVSVVPIYKQLANLCLDQAALEPEIITFGVFS